jgi:hypothetical protein
MGATLSILDLYSVFARAGDATNATFIVRITS